MNYNVTMTYHRIINALLILIHFGTIILITIWGYKIYTNGINSNLPFIYQISSDQFEILPAIQILLFTAFYVLSSIWAFVYTKLLKKWKNNITPLIPYIIILLDILFIITIIKLLQII